MATMLARNPASVQAAFSSKVRGVRPAAVTRRQVSVRAEEKSVAKSDRSGDQLYFTSKSTLAYLDGTLPGDFGFDPLGLMNPVNSGGVITPEWLKYSEVIHCRFAMLGAAGCVGPEALGKLGLVPEVTNVEWFKSGLVGPATTYSDYWMDPMSLFWVEIILVSFAEHKRLQDFRYPGSQGKQFFVGLEAVLGGSGDPAYPGGQWFNLFNLGANGDMNKLKLNELRNGRLAMLAVWGYGAQAVLTNKGPIQNLLDHLSDPVHNNMLGNFLPQ